MVKIKSSAEIAKAYTDAIGRVPGKYKEGVSRTTDWAEKASSDSAETLWAARIAEAAAAKRRQKAVSAVSNAEWQSKAANVGAARIATGMTANAAKRTTNFEPFRSAIEGVSIADRTDDWSSNIDNRLKPIVKALVDTKKGIKG